MGAVRQSTPGIGGAADIGRKTHFLSPLLLPLPAAESKLTSPFPRRFFFFFAFSSPPNRPRHASWAPEAEGTSFETRAVTSQSQRGAGRSGGWGTRSKGLQLVGLHQTRQASALKTCGLSPPSASRSPRSAFSLPLLVGPRLLLLPSIALWTDMAASLPWECMLLRLSRQLYTQYHLHRLTRSRWHRVVVGLPDLEHQAVGPPADGVSEMSRAPSYVVEFVFTLAFRTVNQSSSLRSDVYGACS